MPITVPIKDAGVSVLIERAKAITLLFYITFLGLAAGVSKGSALPVRIVQRRLTNYGHGYMASMRAGAMFPQVDTLPRAQPTPTIYDRHGQVCLCQNAANMG